MWPPNQTTTNIKTSDEILKNILTQYEKKKHHTNEKWKLHGCIAISENYCTMQQMNLLVYLPWMAILLSQWLEYFFLEVIFANGNWAMYPTLSFPCSTSYNALKWNHSTQYPSKRKWYLHFKESTEWEICIIVKQCNFQLTVWGP